MASTSCVSHGVICLYALYISTNRVVAIELPYRTRILEVLFGFRLTLGTRTENVLASHISVYKIVSSRGAVTMCL